MSEGPVFTGPLEDRQLIRERIDAYCDAVFRHDAEAWADCWTKDAVWQLPGMEMSGRDKMVEAWKVAMTTYDVAGFFGHPGAIHVDGNHATVRTHTLEILTLRAGGLRRLIGSYDDRLVKEDGTWRFASRVYTILHQQTD